MSLDDLAALGTLIAQDAGEGPADALIRAALARAARDNITAVVVDVTDLSGAA